jgi:hypothetical protein
MGQEELGLGVGRKHAGSNSLPFTVITYVLGAAKYREDCMRSHSSIVTLVASLTLTSQSALAACNMTQIVTHGDPAKTEIYASLEGAPGIYFVSDMDVNTDGSAKSYHPLDPWAKTLALNNLKNAITVARDKNGVPIP